MMKYPVAFLLFFALSACQTELPQPVTAEPAEAPTVDARILSGGKATVFDRTREAFSHRIPGTELTERTHFFTGESLFDQNWIAAPASTVARDGLGPLFNARSCAACHGKDGRSNPFLNDEATEPAQALLVRLSEIGTDSHPELGGQLHPFALPKLEGEGQIQIQWQSQTGTYTDGTTYTLQKPQFTLPITGEALQFSVRQSPQLVGLGLLEQIAESDIMSQADPEDTNGDGISGRPNRVWNVLAQQNTLGRFGWKANQPTVKQQVAGAFNGDLGITTSLFPHDDTTPSQQQVHEKAYEGPVPHGGEPELSDRLLERVTFYVQKLAVPARRDVNAPAVEQGEALFNQLQCQKCHTPGYTLNTPEGTDTIRPYTDLLLHDMGPGLADQRPDFEATGQEWRTPPLWGIGLIETVNGHTRFLHDGRARNLTEAVLWHGGEAQASQNAFKNLSLSEREALIAFLESL